MICRWLTSLLIVASLEYSSAQDAPTSCPSWSAEFNPVNHIQVGGSAGACNSTAIEELLTLTHTILELLQNQEPCCTPSPTPGACASNPCQNGGTCTPTNEGLDYQCTCSAGYTGATCASDVNECASNPCQNGGTCTDEVNRYSCECSPGFIGTNCLVPQDCADIMAAGTNFSGVFYIFPDGVDGPLRVYCDMDTDGGGWTVFQRRENGSVDFFLEWDDYKHGFGNVSSEHWLGNDNIHHLSTQNTYELRVDLEDFEGESRFAVYSGFSIGDEAAKYVLTVSGYSGNAGDSLMSYHSGHPFTTKDRDNDSHNAINCASRFTGAWWYVSCHKSNLNGLYLYGENDQVSKGVNWFHWHGFLYSLKKTEMKIRPL